MNALVKMEATKGSRLIFSSQSIASPIVNHPRCGINLTLECPLQISSPKVDLKETLALHGSIVGFPRSIEFSFRVESL
jgi:hypothetical protein